MEIDIEILLNDVSENDASILESQAFIERKKKKYKTVQDISIRQEAGSTVGVVDQIVRVFLSSHGSVSNIIKSHLGVLSIGVFYNTEESVVFPFKLSRETIEALADLNLAIDVTGYPCSPEE